MSEMSAAEREQVEVACRAMAVDGEQRHATGAHQRLDIKRREALEQTVPHHGHQSRCDQELRKSRKRVRAATSAPMRAGPKNAPILPMVLKRITGSLMRPNSYQMP